MIKSCKYCNKEYKTNHQKTSFYCSKDCMMADYKIRFSGSNNPNYRNLKSRVCETCGNEFTTYQKGQRFCSKPCAGKTKEMKERLVAMSKIKRTKKGIRPKRYCSVKYCTCKECNKLFTLPLKKKRAYCYGCYKPITKFRVCVICSKEFKSYNNKSTCSGKCLSVHRSNYQKGDKSHRWQGGKTSEAMIIRTSYDYEQWRKAVFERDNYTCQECGQRGGRLSADHIKPFCNYPELRLNVDNGKTLCVPCHRKTPTWGRKATWKGQVNKVESLDEILEVINI